MTFEEIVQKYNLTSSEAQIVASACKGLSNDDVAKSLGIVPNTVREHLKNAYKKFGVNSKGRLLVAIEKERRA